MLPIKAILAFTDSKQGFDSKISELVDKPPFANLKN
jgi:hypothetical protein